VGLEVTLGDESLSAFQTHERSLSSMSSHVSLEVSCLGELLEALLEGTHQELLLLFGSLDSLKVHLVGLER